MKKQNLFTVVFNVFKIFPCIFLFNSARAIDCYLGEYALTCTETPLSGNVQVVSDAANEIYIDGGYVGTSIYIWNTLNTSNGSHLLKECGYVEQMVYSCGYNLVSGYQWDSTLFMYVYKSGYEYECGYSQQSNYTCGNSHVVVVSNTSAASTPVATATPTPTPSSTSTPIVGATLTPFTMSAGSSITIGDFVLSMQTDGNLVLYDSSTALWAASFSDSLDGNPVAGRSCSSCFVNFQEDGNLVLYDSDGAYWATMTQNNPDSHISILSTSPYFEIVSADGAILFPETEDSSVSTTTTTSSSSVTCNPIIALFFPSLCM